MALEPFAGTLYTMKKKPAQRRPTISGIYGVCRHGSRGGSNSVENKKSKLLSGWCPVRSIVGAIS